MRNQGQLFLGGAIILVGLLFLIGNLADIDTGAFCWPIAFILLGVWLVLRPQMIAPDVMLTQRFLGTIRRRGTWQVADEEVWSFVADLKLDMTDADIPEGETSIKTFGFVTDLTLLVPKDVGVSVSSSAFVSSVKMLDRKEESFVAPLRIQTDNYDTAARKIQIEMIQFVAEVKIRRS